MRSISISKNSKDGLVYICICNAVTDKAVRECAEDGARSVEDLTARLGVAAGCGRCRECATELLREACCKALGAPKLAAA
jgi:bacterioferritin-associated ferredoxin